MHLLGLVSDGGVHSGWSHLRALIELGAELGVEDLVLHAFTDGRDTLPEVGRGLPRRGRELDARLPAAAASAPSIGRYYAMDRDKRWDRVQLAYDLLVHGRGEYTAASGPQAARDAYERGETDEFIKPVRRRRGGADPAGGRGADVQLPSGPDA